MTGDDRLVVETDARGVRRITLNRPALHNAFDDALIASLTDRLVAAEDDRDVRVVVLAGAGKSFSAGADINWMRRMAGYSEAENLADARRLAGLMSRLNGLAKPTVAAVQGAALGGGVGLAACCDIVLASRAASFALSEVKLGLVPAVISPYVVATLGEAAARRYFLTGERFDAEEAYRLGLVHRVVAPEALETALEDMLAVLLAGGPGAQEAAKALVFAVGARPIDAAVVEGTAVRIAAVRAGAEAREGLAAFLEKRKPAWTES